MSADDSGRTASPFCPAVEALLAYERIIVPAAAIARARMLTRARLALRTGNAMFCAPSVSSIPSRRLPLVAAAGLALLASGALAFQLVSSLQTTRRGHATPTSAATTSGLRPASTVTPAPEATAPSHGSASADGVSLPAPRLGKDDDAFSELRLLERALEFNGRGEYAAVLVMIAEHERRYPAGRLSEEREVLRLRALLGLRRHNEARQTAARFRRDFPQSVLLPRVEEMLAASP
jgi:hypothetical protein